MHQLKLSNFKISLKDLDGIDCIFEINESQEALLSFLKNKVEDHLELKSGSIANLEILKRSLDARGNREPQYNFSLAFDIEGKRKILKPQTD